MAPGVGKTYAMLEAARRELAAGRDVVIGLRGNSRAQKKPTALTEGLLIIPRRTAEYRGVTLTEMDSGRGPWPRKNRNSRLVDEFRPHQRPQVHGIRSAYQDVLETHRSGD